MSAIPLTDWTYAKINSGSCETHSMTDVQDKSECELAATSLGLQDISAYEYQRDFVPYECTYSSRPWLVWNPPNGSDSSADCGTKIGLDTYACICRHARKQIF